MLRILLTSSLFLLLACSGGAEDLGHTHYSLKVVAKSQAGKTSTRCLDMGNSAGGTSGDSLAAGRWMELASSNAGGSTEYFVRITGKDDAFHEWRYDESMARAGTTLEDSYTDLDGETKISIRGSFAGSGPCEP
jgi:hypothetical protein